MATPANSSNSDSEPEIGNSSSPNPSLTSNALAISNQSSPPLVCLFKFAGDSAAGAFMGSIFGYVLQALYKRSHPIAEDEV